MIINSVMMQNHTNHRVGPLVSRSSVTPNEIFERVEAKHDIDAPIEVQRTMVARFCTGMSKVCLPKPKDWPIWVMMASMRRKI